MNAQIRDQITEAAESLSATLGIGVCYHDYVESLAGQIPDKYRNHRHPSCLAVKEHVPERCIGLDVSRVQLRLQKSTDIFCKVCHGGLAEIVAPLHTGSVLAGTLFLGPLQWEGASPPRGGLVTASRPTQLRQWGVDNTGLPVLRPDNLGSFIQVAAMLVARIEKLLESSAATALQHKPRAWLVERFLQLRGTEDIRISDLARTLYLCESRTGHFLKEEFGMTFPQIITRWRTERAKDLLANTSLPVAAVGRSVGFAEPGYFHRVFRKAARTTPGRYRKQHQRAAVA